MEQRHRFVSLAESGHFTFTELCEQFSISRKTGYKWLARYRKSGNAGLADRSRAPLKSPQLTSVEVERFIVSERRQRPTWGPKKIQRILTTKYGLERPPAVSTVGEILKRNGLVTPRETGHETGQVSILDITSLSHHPPPMPRAPRIEYAGAIYHIIARGDRREPIVTDDIDRNLFVKTLAEVCESSEWEVFAWVLLDNHYHLALRTPEPNLVTGMQWFQTTFTRRINARHKLWGHLFGGRYKAILVEDETPRGSTAWSSYLLTLIDYIHLNPVRAGLCGDDTDGLAGYQWSSLSRDYALPPTKRRSWMQVAETFDLLGMKDTARSRREFLARLESRARSEEQDKAGLPEMADQSLQSTIKRGWYWGSSAFKESLLEEFGDVAEDGTSRTLQASGMVKENSEARAERILSDAAKFFGSDLVAETKVRRGDLRRVAIAWAIARKTRVPQSWIAEKLGLCTGANVSQRIRRFETIPLTDLEPRICDWKRRFLTPDP